MLSIIIPVYNEAESLDPLFAEIDEVARASHYQLDVVFVDDGSTDGSWQKIVALSMRAFAASSFAAISARRPR